MESPPSFSGWSEAPISISEDSGLPLTSGSVSSGSVSGERVICELPDSDGEDKSLSQYDSLDYSDSGGMCGEHFNTLKKGPTVINLPIDPPPEFQDSPPSPATRIYDLPAGANVPKPWIGGPQICASQSSQNRSSREGCSKRVLSHRLWPADTVAFSPVHSLSRPVCTSGSARSCSAASGSRLYSSHNSLSVVQNGNPDDSNFITQAMSHDALNREISDIYNVPFDSDIYALPVDTVRPLCEHNRNSNRTPVKPKRQIRQHRKRRRNTSASSQCELDRSCDLVGWERITSVENDMSCQKRRGGKRHSVAGSSGATSTTHISQEPHHMTLEEVRNYLHTLYSSSSDSSENQKNRCDTIKNHLEQQQNLDNNNQTTAPYKSPPSANCTKKTRKAFMLNVKNKKVKDSTASVVRADITAKESAHVKSAAKKISTASSVAEAPSKQKKSNFLLQSLCNIFRFRKAHSPDRAAAELKKPKVSAESKAADCDKEQNDASKKKTDLCKRALPPLPSGKLRVEGETHEGSEDTSMDFTLSIEKVKDYGWYWGPISGEAAERILLNEPDGSFIVRDSSDHHYIFSLTFKLNGCVRHVRIEHDQGNFSFGSCTKFKSHTIVEFIENAVEHSRSGRYLFFLHRRPVLGPMRVQLLHPVSRFKQVQSLQHMCRFIILKHVRRDLIPSLPLPRRVIDYLSTKQYYSELLADGDSERNCDSETNHHQTPTDQALTPGQSPDDQEQPPPPPVAAQSAVIHVITTETNRDGLDRYRFHVIDTDSSDVEPPQPQQSNTTAAEAEKEGGGATAGGSSDSSDLNEIEGIRRGGRFRLGLRNNNRERRHSQRQSHCYDES